MPFIYLSKTTSNSGPSISVTLPNKKQWQIYIVTRYGCNLTDTFSSNYVLIDNTPPALLNIDSVSVEMSSQQIVAGWSAAPEPDVMGYSIFKVDPGTGNNILLKDSSTLFYKFSTSTFNSNSTGNRIAIAVFDSCTNGGVICNYHSPSVLSYNMTTNLNYRCNKKFTFSWTPYVGWTADRYGVWYEVNSSGNWIYLEDVTNTTYTFDIPQLDKNYKFFIRAFKTPGSGGITSTSNIISVALPGHPKPTFNEIGHVSVTNNNSLEITGKWNNPASGYTSEIFFSDDGFMSNKLQNTKTLYNIKHSGLLVSQQRYYYKNIVFNPCGEACDTSETHSSIVLRRNGNNMSWDEYSPWFGSLLYNLEKKSNNDIRWSIEFNGSNNNYILTDTSVGLCFRVKAVKDNNDDSAFSNTICLFVKDTTLIPSGFNPEGNNPRFKIVNPNISAGQAVMSIYDRWGGKLWEGDALQGWNGTYNGDVLPMGVYIYKVVLRRPVKNELFGGTVYLIR